MVRKWNKAEPAPAIHVLLAVKAHRGCHEKQSTRNPDAAFDVADVVCCAMLPAIISLGLVGSLTAINPACLISLATVITPSDQSGFDP